MFVFVGYVQTCDLDACRTYVVAPYMPMYIVP